MWWLQMFFYVIFYLTNTFSSVSTLYTGQADNYLSYIYNSALSYYHES